MMNTLDSKKMKPMKKPMAKPGFELACGWQTGR